MYNLISSLKNRQVVFFCSYYIIVVALIVWSYVEGVGDISGRVIVGFNTGTASSLFKAGYFTTLNYGIYYLTFLPLFLRSVFTTYFTADKLSNLSESHESDPKVRQAIHEYSSNIIGFTRRKWSSWIFISLLVFFICQNVIVERNDYKNLSLGWVQGLELQRKLDSPDDTITIHKKFYFRNDVDPSCAIQKKDSVRVTGVSFASKRVPSQFEFVSFVIIAKLFFSLFTAVVFFFNINILYGLLMFFGEADKKYLFKSNGFIATIDKLISNISLSGFFLTIFLFFRYIANAQKGSFKPFNSAHILAADQYIFLLGVFFIPVCAVTLFVYVYISNHTINLNRLTWRNIITFYIPNISFLLVFFIYLINFDPAMETQLQFMKGLLKFFDKFFLPG